MGTKTITLKDEAYRRLKAARRYPGESFSEVVLRASWPEDTITARGFLDLHVAGRTMLRDDELDRIVKFKAQDRPPEDKWADR
jgi:predicted CopG family antitoxin